MIKKVAIVGIQGVPAKYGGFETLVENMIGENFSPETQYTVFCSSKDFKTRLTNYKGANLKYIPLHANGVQSTPYDILSLIKVMRGYDIVLILGVSGCIFLPFFRLLFRGKLIVNIDGMEHRRGKWGGFAKRFLQFSEFMAIKFADIIVVDNKGVQDYVTKKYKKNSTLIAYGGEQVLREVSEKYQLELLKSYDLESKGYSLAMCRIEPENNCHLILETYAQTCNSLVFLGNWDINKYSRELYRKYKTCSNIHLHYSSYDLDLVYALRKHCIFYIHGHSTGGTNPSLVEAMFLGCRILAFDCVFNKETTEYKANYFKDKEELDGLLSTGNYGLKDNGSGIIEIANRRYLWKFIRKQYEELYGRTQID